MPGNLLNADTSFPEVRGKTQDAINRNILDYLYMLLEQLRYSFGNIGLENFNGAEFQRMTELIQGPVYAKIEGAEGDITELSLLASGLMGRISDAEGNITALSTQAGEIIARVSGAEGNITELSATAKGLLTRVSDAEGNLTSLTETSQAIDARLSNAEGDVTELTATAKGLLERIQNDEGELTTLSATAAGLASRVSDAEGNITSLTETSRTIDARLSNAEGNVTELTATAKGILERLSNSEGDVATLMATAESLTASVQNLSTGMGHTLRLGEDGMTVYDANGKKVIISNGNLNLDGAISWGEIGEDLETYIKNASSTASSAKTAASSAQTDASNAQKAASSAQSTASSALESAQGAMGIINQWSYVYNGRTYINGNELMTGTVTASTLRGGQVQLLDTDGLARAVFDLAPTTGGIGMELTANKGIRLLSQFGNLHFQSCTINSDFSAHLTIYGGLYDDETPRVQVGGGPLVSSQQQTLGRAAQLWGTIYSASGTIQTSDREHKHDIEPLPDKYVELFDSLRSVRYKYDDGASNRYHVGFIAQEVKEAMDERGIDSTEFGGWVADVDENSNPIYMLRYEEFIGILWAKVRELDARVRALQAA